MSRKAGPSRASGKSLLGESRAGQDPNFHLVTGLVDASVHSLTRVTELLDRAQFAALVKILAKANAIYLVGSKRAFPATMYMSLALSQLGIGNILVDNIGSTAFGQIGCTAKRDAVLAVSFSPYNSITPELAATAAQRGTPLVSITDSAFSPLVPLSDAWLEVMESEFGGFRSMAATIAVGMAVVLAVAKTRQGAGK